MKNIKVTNARVHNLKGIDVSIPRNKLSVITGPSGSGKSSLAFDTIYVEGQRRYIESLSSYAKHFMTQMEPPEVESITGLSPTIAIDQKTTITGPRSTVGTVTEIYDFMRVLFSKVATAHCPETGDKLVAFNAEQICDDILKRAQKKKTYILATIIRHQKGEHRQLLAKYTSAGFARVRVNGAILRLDEDLKIEANSYNTVDVVVDRLVPKENGRTRLAESVALALKIAGGNLFVLIDDEEFFYSEKLYSPKISKSYPELSAKSFSFNSPVGACEYCQGLGSHRVFDKDKIIVNTNLSIAQGAIVPLYKKNDFILQMVRQILEKHGFCINTSYSKIPKKIQQLLLYGSKKVYDFSFISEGSEYQFKQQFSGVIALLEKMYQQTVYEGVSSFLENFMSEEDCQHCNAQRLRPYPLHARIAGLNIMDWCALSLDELLELTKKIRFESNKKILADKLLSEIQERLNFLVQVGLSYLTLARTSQTLSGGESQRIRLATQIGSALSGVVYVLDEPSIGLHQRDNLRLIESLKKLRDLGNTVIVVEHDEQTMRDSDYLIDIGPGAGVHGGNIVAQGHPLQLLKKPHGLTSDFLSGKKAITPPKERRRPKAFLEIRAASLNNLDNLDARLALGVLCAVTGVSGSGKSTLVHDILVPGLKNILGGHKPRQKFYQSIIGAEQLNSIVELDQKPIGRTPKSNPATYTKLFDSIRQLFANTNEAKVRGYNQGRFSFNVKSGRCEHCEGNGSIKLEMNFLPDVSIPCNHCKAKRYNEQTLSIRYRGKNIADVLNMTIEEAFYFFEQHASIARSLRVVMDIGLGYLTLGQPATTLSGGEAQRLKLARELSKKVRGHCLYVLDEPTTGLHFNDIKVLLGALNRLVDLGHSVLVIEHNLDVIKSSDYVIDLGPQGGRYGGKIVASGTPEQVCNVKQSHTGYYLNELLLQHKSKERGEDKFHNKNPPLEH